MHPVPLEVLILEKEKQRQREQQPQQIQLPLPEPPPDYLDGADKQEGEKRGVVIIDVFGDATEDFII